MKMKRVFDADAFFMRRFPKFCEVESRCKELEKKAESDAALIESLNRYIATLEGRADFQAEMIQGLQEQLRILLDPIRNRKETPAIKKRPR